VPPAPTFAATPGLSPGHTTITPHGGNSYDVTVTVSDGQLSDSESFTITVNNVGGGLAIEPIDDQIIDELVPFSYQVNASGSSGGGLLNIDFETAADGAPLSSGDVIAEQFAAMGIHITSHNPAKYPPMIFDSSNPTGGDRDLGTPNSKFGGPGIGNGGKSGRWKNDVARENILIISEDGDSQDPDDRARGGKLILTFDTPTAIDEIGLLDVDSGRNTIYLYDAAGRRISKVNIPRRGDNSHQVLALNAEGVSRLELVLCGSGAITDLIFDRDGNPPTGGGPLTYALAPGAPAGMTISDTGLIEWTPTEAQGPSAYDVTVEVSDGASTVTETFTVTVAEVNVAPQVAPIGNQTIDELSPFSLQVTASDSDLPQNTLTYSLASGAPDGMTISCTGLIDLTPTEAQGPGNYSVTVEVSDGTASATEAFQISVNEVNLAPVITPIGNQAIDELSLFSYQVVASDADLPQNTLTYSLASGAPDGMTISNTGLIEWTPTEAQGPSVNLITVEVSDGTTTTTENFQVTVGEVNVAPVIAAIEDQNVDEESPFSYLVQVSDADLPANTLTYSLGTGSPAGMTISAAGLIEWTPTEAQGPADYLVKVEVTDGTVTSSEEFTITVNEVNLAPVLSPIADRTIDEQVSFSLQTTATDPDRPNNILTYRLTGTPPTGMAIDSSGLLTWTPTEVQGPGTYEITVEVSDGELTDSKTFEIEVAEVNKAPEISEIDDIAFNEHSAWTLQVEASDPDFPANDLTYDLIGTVPVGMGIDANGLISWTPTEAQGHADATYTIEVEVSDGDLTDVETFTITVNELNQDPVLAPIGNQTVVAGKSLTFTAAATDGDIPVNNLVYSITGDVPAAATLNSVTGEFGWNSAATDPVGDLSITVTVDDQAGGTDSETFTITVQPPATSSITLTEGDRFQTTATQAIVVPADASYFEFEILNLSFDTDATGKISDAFEVALLDANGISLVHTVAADRDSFFNLSEPGTEAAAANTIVDGAIVRVDLSHIAAGTQATIVYRLVNNDNAGGNDTDTTVTVSEGEIVTGDLNTATGAAAVQQSEATGSVDLSTLTDVTGSFGIEYAQTSFNDDNSTLFADVWLTNNANQPIDGPFIIVVENLTDPLVAATDFDGRTSDGKPYYIVEDLSDSGSIQPGATTLAQTLTFFNPDNTPFDYKLTVLAAPNEAPTFTSTPITLVEAGRPYSYDANADDPDGDTLTYELLAGPEGMTIDSATGEISWSPETGDEGNHSVVIKASDGRGAFDEQQFTVEVRNLVPNRPPVIISTPAIQAFVATEATQETGNLVVNGDFEDGDTGFQTDYFNGGIGVGARQYSITTNPSSAHSLATSYGDFTTGTGNMMAVNGSTTPGQIVWEQTVAVVPGRTYDFAAAISSWYPGDPAALLFTVNGEDIGALNAPYQTAQWEQLFATWDSEDATTATIRIVNANTVYGGNDFALDDIYFGGPRFSNPSYQYDVNAIDADADPITYALDQAPDGMSIDQATGLIGWNPNADQLGTHTVRVIADDGRGGTATQEYQIVVLADKGNDAPVIISDPVDSFFIPGFSNPASGDVTPQRISLDLGNGETFDGTVSITLPAEAGRFADIVISVDESSSMGGDQDWIPGMIPQLDDALKAQGIGATSENPNRFAIVGGGRQNLVSYFFSQQPNTKYTLYGPNNEVVAEGMIDEVLPDELLNLQLEDDGRYVLVVEAENAANLNGGIDIGIEGDLGDGARIEPLALNTLVSDAFTLPGQAVEYQFSLDVETLLYFDTQTKDLYSTIGWTLEGPNGPIASQNSIQFSDVADSTPTIAAGPGDYVLRLDAKYDTASDFKFQLLDLSAVTPLTSGQSVSDEFETKVETKAYRFSASQGQIFSLNNTNAVVHSGSKWRLFDQSGSVLLSQSMGTNIAGFELPSTGEFYLLMEAALWPHEGNAQLRQPSVFDFTAEFVDPLPPTAIAPGDTVNGVIDFVGDFEVYSFTVASRSNLYIDSLTDNSMTWTLTGPTGTRSALRFNSTDSFNSANPVLNLVDGDYTMRIDSNGQTGPFAFRVLDLADATAITPGTEFDGELTVPNETDVYSFAATAGDEILIDVVTASDVNNTEYKLYTQYGEKIFESSGLSDSGTLTIPADGTYTLLVEGWQRNVDQDTYTINVVPVTSTTQPLSLGTVTNGVLATSGESAVYTFSLGADTQLYFDSLTNDSNVLWSLEGPRGEEVSPLRFDRSDSLDRVDASIDALAGDYRLTIQGNGDHVGSYSFSLLDLFNSAHSTVVSPNPGAGNPSVTISPNAGLVALQTEVFRFTAAAGDEFSFVTTVTGSIGSSYRVLDSTGTEVIPRTSLSTDQSNETLTAGGTFFLLVEPRYNNVDVDVWSMDINFVQNNGTTSFSGTPLVLGTTINGDLNTASQVDEFTFAVTQRGTYYFDSLTNNGTIRWSLSGPTGTVISNRTLTSTDAHNQTNVGLDLIPGNYQIAIEASSGTPGTYGFRFQNLESAAPITFGTPFGEDLTPANESDLYKFDVVAGETFYFDVEAASDVNNSLYRVIDPFGRTAFTANDLRDFGPTTLDYDGTYTLLVEGWRGNVDVDTYSMNVHKVPVNAAIPLSLGDTITDSFSTPGETAVYTFSVTDYTQVHFDSLTNSAIYNWQLEGAAGTIVDGRGFHQSDSSNVAQAVIELTPGDYRITIEGTGETQDYSFRLLDISDATPIVFDTATTSPHANTKSTQVFDFDVQTGDTFFFDAQSATGFSTSATWRLFDPYGNEVFERALTQDQGPVTLDVAGTYRILVEGRNSDTGSDGEFVFEVVALGNALNPTSPTAITVGDVVNGDIAKVHETDRYTFTLSNESLIYFDSLTNESSLNWSLQKKSGGTVVSNRAFSSSDSSGNASPVLNLRAGDYELSVTSNAKEPYSFQLQNLASATSVVPGTQFSSELNPINKTDVWQFTADAQEAFYLDVVSTSDSSAYVRVIDQFGRVAVQKTSLTDIDVFKLPHEGTYYLLVEGRINETSATAYEMNVISVTKTQAALNLGETQAGAIAGIGDTTEYKFNLPSLATLYFDSLTDSALVWSLTGPGGSVITNKRFNASDSFNNATPLLKSLPAGDYTLTVDGTGDAVGNFSFRLLDIATDATPITLGTPVSGELTIPNETDIYQFTMTTGDQLLVDWLAADDTNNSLYRMFDPLNNEVLEVSALLDGETGQLSGTGIYTLLVEGYRTNTGLDTYAFNVINSPTRTVAINVGDLVSESIATPGERVVFPFNVGADSFLYLDSLTNNSQFNWSLTGPTGEIFSQRRLDQSDSTGQTTPVFEARSGDYTLTVDGVNDATGAVDFQLWDVASGSPFSLPATIGDFVTVGGALEPLDPGNSTNIYRFDAIAGDNLSFDGVPDADNTASYRVVDPFGRTVFTRSIGSDQNNVELAVSGTYTLLIEGAIGSQLADAYELNITFNGNTAPPAIIGDAYLLGTTILPTDSTPPQTPQSYTFNLTDRTLVHMDILTNDSDLRWTLRGPRGVEVDSRSFTSTDSIDSATSNLDLVVGDYQLNIFSNTGASKPFGFTLHNFADAQSVTPGTPFTGELTNPTETDLYQFNANAGDRFLIDVVSTNAAGNKEFKVIDGYGNVVADSSSSLKDVDNLLTPHDGTYTLLVEGRRNNTGTDTYTLNIVPIVKTTLPLTAGESNTTNLTIGSELEYTFSVASPSLIVFSPQTDTDLVEWTLSSAAGTFIANRAFDDGLLPLDLPSGDYTLTVNGVDDYAGDAKFTLLTADAANVLADGVIANSQLTASRGVELYQFNGIAGQHFALRPDFNLVFDDAAASALTADDLSTSFDNEDAHSGIDVALRNDVFRDGAAINFIAITDEDRDVLDDNVNFETIFRDLSARDALLNSVVSSPFYVENTSGARAIGVDSDGNAYIADGSGGFTTSTGGIATTNQISIRQDYIDLAWALDGAAWDLSQLRAGGVTAQSFTKAFVDVKVSEILEQTSLKLSASDPNADLTFITPDDGVYDNIVGGQQYDFDIQIGNDGNPRSFDLLFKQGQTVGSIPVYIVAPYGYNAMAVDADGDTLTWSITEGPDGLVVDPATGVLAWPADSVVYGVHPVTLRVEDGRGGFDEQTFELDVNGGEAASISGVKFEDENEDGLYQTLVDVIVPGDADPYLAGMPDGSTASGGDVAPDQSPIFVEGLELIPGTVLTFAAAGQVSFAGAPNVNETPDGKLSGYGSHAVGAENGISNITSNWNSLLGVFLTDDQPDSNPAPAALDFINASGVPGGINYTSLAPELQQLFFIGDGVTDDGTIQEITVPEGATRLFLGTMDGTGWFNNAGQLFVTISGPQEPTIPDWTIYLDQNRNGIRDDGERSTITDANGSFAFDNLQPGSYVVAEELQPGWAQTAPGTGTFEITVAPGESATGLNFGNKQVPLVNSDPFITSTPLLSVVAREDYRYQPTITELDGDDLAFDLPLGPAGMAVNPVNGTISWTPRLDQIGPQNVLLRVRDERGGFDLQYFTIDVQKPNTAPVITSTPPAGPAGVGLPFTYNADAVDADDDSLTWSLTAAPEGATIDPVTGVINWTPASDQQGAQSFEVAVDDGRELSATQAFDINVQVDPPNTDPEFLSTPPVEAYLGNAYLYRVQANDANGDPLAIALDAAPSGMAIDADGLISWTPTPTQVGSNLVRITVDDGRGGTATQEYSVNVDTQPVNQAPQITSPPKTSAVAGQAYNFQPTATDANNDTLVWELVTGPGGMSINPSTGELNWNPTIDDIGTEQVVIRVLDTSAAYSELGYTLNVRAINTPPVIGSTPLTSAAVGATYFYGVAATDADADLLTYSLSSAPTGMAIDPTTGVIVWTPVAGQEGTNAVVVSVTDGNGGNVSQSFDVVTAAGVSNLAPTITSTPGFFASVGELYSYDADATDPESAALTYELLQSPTGMTIDANSGLIEWTPAAGDLGTSIVRIVARDPAGAGSIQEFSLTVLPANNAPVINSTPPATVPSGGVYRYDVLATDADGEFLTYELTTAPAGMLIDGVGRIFWVPTDGQVGSNSVEVLVRDPRGGVATQAFDITVEVDSVDPQVAVLLSANPVNIGDSVDIRVSAIDNVGVESLSLTLDGVPVALDSTGVARVPMNSLGSITAVATATDAAGNSASDTITIFVADPNDVEGPVLNITSPSDGGIITAVTDVIGTVTDDTLVEYRLYVAPFGTNNFQQIGSGNANITNDVLGKIDPTLLANGSYILRLEAFDAGGRANVVEQQLEIAGELKLGNFQLAFTDLTIPVSGIDITVSRIYNTLDANRKGDFGYGWSLDYRDANLQVNIQQASEFDRRYGFYTPLPIGARVYVTLPGGKREGFTFTPTLRTLPGFGASLTVATPRFTPDPGVTSTLSVQNATLLVNEFGEMTVAGGLPWNPASPDFGGGYILTTRDGTQFKIDGDTGLLNSIRDQNGNSLMFSNAGITSSVGQSVSFERDAQGRIARILDPEGQPISFAYSDSGNLVAVTDRRGNTTEFTYLAAREHYLDEVIDPLGRTGVRSEYDDEGRLKKSYDLNGNAVEFVSDPGMSVQTIIDPSGNPQLYAYDELGRVVETVDALGNRTESTYDSNGHLSSITDALGNVTRYSHNALGLPTEITFANGAVERLTYDAFGRVTSTIDPLGHTSKFEYDNQGNLTAYEDALGQRSLFTYDSAGNNLSTTDPLGNTTAFAYDASGNLTSETDATGFSKQYDVTQLGYRTAERATVQTSAGSIEVSVGWTYDANGNLLSSTDTNGNASSTSYSSANELSAATNQLGQVVEFTNNGGSVPAEIRTVDGAVFRHIFDESNRMVARINSVGSEERFEYDLVGNLVLHILPDDTPDDFTDNPMTHYEYDAIGQMTATVDAMGHRTESEYDLVGQQVLARDGLGNETRFAYDLAGQLLSETDPRGFTTSHVYDDLGRKIRTLYPDGSTTEFAYDALGNLTSLTDELGRETKYAYNSLNRLVRVTDAIGAVTEYEYNEFGMLSVVRDPRGNQTQHVYDAQNQLISTEKELGQTATVDYRADGNVASSVDFNGDTTTYDYDARGRLTEKAYQDGSIVTFTYDTLGNRTSYEDDRGTTTFEYDTQNRITRKTEADGNAISYQYDTLGNVIVMATPNGVTEYVYDANSRLIRVDDSDSGISTFSYDETGNLSTTEFANGVTEVRSYDSRSRLISMITTDSLGQVLLGLTYTIDAVGNRIRLVEDTGRVVDYTYDNANRLGLESINDPVSGTRTISYTYDAFGNRLTRNDSVEGLTEYSYDANNRLISETTGGVTATLVYDGNGNLLSRIVDANERTTYTWDFENRLRSATVTEQGQSIAISYEYDYAGNRVSSEQDGERTIYLVDDNRRYAEVVEQTTTNAENVRYTLAFKTLAETIDGTDYYLHGDHLFSTRLVTDEAESVVNQYTYDAFGRVLQSSESIVSPIRFAGEYEDPVTGLIYLRRRQLDTGAGRLISVDPAAGQVVMPSTFHPYTYAFNNPLGFVDPSGAINLPELQLVQSTAQTIGKALVSSLILNVLGTIGSNGSINWVGLQGAVTLPNNAGSAAQANPFGNKSKFPASIGVGVGVAVSGVVSKEAYRNRFVDKEMPRAGVLVTGFASLSGSIGWSTRYGIGLGAITLKTGDNPVVRFLGANALSGPYFLVGVTRAVGVGRSNAPLLLMGFGHGDASGAAATASIGVSLDFLGGFTVGISTAVEPATGDSLEAAVGRFNGTVEGIIGYVKAILQQF